ncbi:hypothetical protein L1987_48681 [Smallanthus sonchifolius]|uniref:Uncharacterized protein n=1 Tax=Smallanthus sonchifolius TaxID=185202 RepID=A0ACB9FSF5_9ASTR|nr:hypothetical protein L1987_48681 [Smallanthus sonchifolius]
MTAQVLNLGLSKALSDFKHLVQGVVGNGDKGSIRGNLIRVTICWDNDGIGNVNDHDISLRTHFGNGDKGSIRGNLTKVIIYLDR